MYSKQKSLLIRLVSITMVFALLVPIYANAAGNETVQPYASPYLDSYQAYVYPAGGGLVQVYFHVQGTGTMDELGALKIEIYECATNSSNDSDWTWKDTFTHNTNPEILSYNDDYHSGHVDYNGTPGKYYKAYVCIWGGKGGKGDTRYFWTSAKKAT